MGSDFSFQCPQCGATLHCKDEWIGKTASCKTCQHRWLFHRALRQQRNIRHSKHRERCPRRQSPGLHLPIQSTNRAAAPRIRFNQNRNQPAIIRPVVATLSEEQRTRSKSLLTPDHQTVRYRLDCPRGRWCVDSVPSICRSATTAARSCAWSRWACGRDQTQRWWDWIANRWHGNMCRIAHPAHDHAACRWCGRWRSKSSGERRQKHQGNTGNTGNTGDIHGSGR